MALVCPVHQYFYFVIYNAHFQDAIQKYLCNECCVPLQDRWKRQLLCMKKRITLFCFILACSFYRKPTCISLCPRLGNHQVHSSCDVDNFSDPLFLIALRQGSAASAALHLFGKSQPPPQTVDFPSCPRSGEQTPALVN